MKGVGLYKAWQVLPAPGVGESTAQPLPLSHLAFHPPLSPSMPLSTPLSSWLAQNCRVPTTCQAHERLLFN